MGQMLVVNKNHECWNIDVLVSVHPFEGDPDVYFQTLSLSKESYYKIIVPKKDYLVATIDLYPNA